MLSAAAAAAASAPTAAPSKPTHPQHAWEDTGENAGHVWDAAVREDADGRIVVAARESLPDAVRRRRRALDRLDGAQRHRRVVRDLIRNVCVVVDASRAARVKDPAFPGPAPLIQVVTTVLAELVQEFYDQNPVSQLGFVFVQDGEAEILSPLSGNSKAHKLALQSLAENCCGGNGNTFNSNINGGGEFSLQNALQVAGRSLGHQPRHGSREIIVVAAALTTCDPGYILTETLPKLQLANIRVSCLALCAEMHILRKLAESTAGTMGVCLNPHHLRDWLMAQCIPPPTNNNNNMDANGAVDYQSRNGRPGCEMIPMGFPSRTSQDVAELVHASRQKTLLARTAFTCPQCQGRNSELPTDCAVCGLKLVLAPHLARSFHHLFPVPSFVENVPTTTTNSGITTGSSGSRMPLVVTSLSSSSLSLFATFAPNNSLLIHHHHCSNTESERDNTGDNEEEDQFVCFACLRPLLVEENQVLRFQCPDCQSLFCLDCDAFLHNSLHNCPGCLGKRSNSSSGGDGALQQ